MSKQDLIDLVQGLQEAAVQHTHFLLALAETSGNRAGKTVETPEKIAERANKIRDICHKEIEKQMKWQPSCKTSSTKWSSQCVVPSTEVFSKVFGVEEGAKPWKQKKISTSEFQQLFGHISKSVSYRIVQVARWKSADLDARCRYNYLNITSDTVSIQWKPDDMTFEVSGTYGI